MQVTQADWLGNFNSTIVPFIDEIKKNGKLELRYFSIANKNICINCSTVHVAEQFTKSLLHLQVSPFLETDLDIFVWEREDNFHNNEVTNYGPEIDCTSTDGLIYQFNEQSISVYDSIKKRAYFWVNSMESLGDWNFAKPFRSIFHWYLSQFDLSMIHGAVVGTELGGVLITAKGGSGKTTTALSCFFGGMNYLSDDYVAIDPSTSKAYSLFNSAMLTQDNLVRFSSLETYVKNPIRPSGIKGLVYLNEVNSALLLSQITLKALLIPKITSNLLPEIVPVNKVSALMAIAPTIRSLRNFEQQKLTAAKQIASNLPCFEFRLSPNVNENVAVLKRFINNRNA
jgi:hypothetical protein